MGSGAIYAVIVALWAVVLIPMWLRKHDEANEIRSVDRYRGAMRSLSRRSTARREVLMPAREPAGLDVVVTGATAASDRASSASWPSTGRTGSRPPAAVRQARAQAATRRRRVLAGLVALLVATLAMVAVHKVPVWTLLLPLGLLGCFVVAARRQVALAASLDRRLVRGAQLREWAESAQDELAHRPRTREQAPRAGGRVVETEAVAGAAVRADGTWDARSHLLPSYVTAPAASRVPRVIDLTHPGHWTGAAMVEQVQRDRAFQAQRLAEQEPLFDQTLPTAPTMPTAPAAPAASFASRFVDDDVAVTLDDDVVLGLDDDSAFFDQMSEQGALEHRRAVND